MASRGFVLLGVPSARRWRVLATFGLITAAISVLGTLTLAAPLVAAPSAMASTAVVASAAAISGSEFDRGNIISDENFFNGNALGPAGVQSFIDSKLTCAPGAVCLANLRVDTFDISATPMCSAYQGAAQESAATIIYKVGHACGISQQTLLVTLQKEQSLVTSPAPSVRQLSAAMGAGCYDDGQPCVDQYAGFFNQIFNGAYLLKRYTQPAGTGPGTAYTSRYDLSYPVGQTSNILVSTNNCGTIPVYVSNQATHSLYLYTPYTPNAAALANLGGTGDDCSSYGNRNFWNFYYSWFGNPLVSPAPIGYFDRLIVIGTTVTASGWAIDGNTTNSIDIRLSVDGGTSTTFPANVNYPGIGNAFPGFGDSHGFSAATVLAPGPHNVCIVATNTARSSSRGLGCKSITVSAPRAPTGWLDRVTVVGPKATVEGWAIDPDTAAPISVSVSVDGGAGQVFVASNPYAGLGGAKPGFGDNHGFSSAVTVPVGMHTVCVTAINDVGTPNQDIGCRAVTIVVGRAPTGWLDSVSTNFQQTTVSGWAIDPDTAAPISVSVSVDGGAGQVFVASNPYPGLGGAKPGYGDNHGFSSTVTVPVGTHTVCVTAINNAGPPDQNIGCRTVTATSQPPIGWTDSISTLGSMVTAVGWAIDPDVISPISVKVSVDGSPAQTFLASNTYPGFGDTHPGFGDAHGFSASVVVPAGSHTVCVTAVNNAQGSDRELMCRAVTVNPVNSPLGWLDSLSASGKTVTAAGWAIDPDTTSPIGVQLVVDGAPQSFVAGNPHPGLGGAFPGFGDNHGFSASVTVPSGTHSVCVIAVNNVPGIDRSLGCSSVTIP